MNTTVFAEEVAVDSAEDAVEATVDAVDEVADEATVDATVDADDNGTVAASEVKEDKDGIFYNYKDGVKDTPYTKVTFASNGDKKKEKINVATIEHTTDPTSWNNIGNGYAADLIATVLFGGEGKDEWLNNSTKVTVSENDPSNGAGLEGLVRAGEWTYKVIPVVEGEQYIFVGYGLDGNNNLYVAGYDDAETCFKATGETYPVTIPVATWDGRQIDYNKSGDSKYTTGKKEALNVAVAFVTYDKATGTVKEINGVNEGSVKVDKKNQKAASVEFATTPATKSYQTMVTKDGKTSLTAVSEYFEEHKTLGDLPYFTIKPSVKGNDAKSYKKDITAKLKDEKFYFGIQQCPVDVQEIVDGETEDGTVVSPYRNMIISKKTSGSVSADDLKTVSGQDITGVQDNIARYLTGRAQDCGKDVEEVFIDPAEDENNAIFKVTKFTDKGATITLRGFVGDRFGGEFKDLKTLSGKGKNAEYSLESGVVAGTSISWLKFVDDGNFVYRPLKATVTTTEFDADATFANKVGNHTAGSAIPKTQKIVDTWREDGTNANVGLSLAPVGYKWAFRKSPDEKSKKFRYGIYKEENNGFVYSVDETAVEEAF